MTYQPDNVVKQKMVQRIKDENDRRSKQVFLANDGLVLNDQLHPGVAGINEIASEGLETPDFVQGNGLLNKMIWKIRNK